MLSEEGKLLMVVVGAALIGWGMGSVAVGFGALIMGIAIVW